MHKNGQICQKCAVNCGIEGNASNENITKYKNLCGVKSISNSVQRLARYRIVALISIGRLCMSENSAFPYVAFGGSKCDLKDTTFNHSFK